MSLILIQILPVIFTFFAGFILKKLSILSSKDGDIFLKLVFYLGIPSLVLTSIPELYLSKTLLFLPISAVIVHIVTGVILIFSAKLMKIDQKTMATALVGVMMMNLGFSLPFIEIFFGKEGIAKALFFDLGNAIFVFTITYAVANYYGTNKDKSHPWLGFLKNPPLIAIFIALILNFAKIQIPEIFLSFFEFTAQMTLPLIMVAIGVKFSFKRQFSIFSFTAIFLRMAGGFFIAFFVLSFINTDLPTTRAVLLGAASPVGFNTITFAVLKGLDEEFAASIVSVSAMTALFLLPLIYVLTG